MSSSIRVATMLGCACACLAASSVFADHVWIGGDQSADPESFNQPENWQDGKVPVAGAAYNIAEKIVITQDVSHVMHNMKGNVQNFYFNGLVLGGEDNPHVTFELSSTRPVSSPSVLTIGTNQSTDYYNSFKGSNTCVIIHPGAVLSFNASLTICDDDVQIIGDIGGGVSYGGTLTVFGRDYGNLTVELNQGDRTMVAQGDMRIPTTLTAHATGSAGINKTTLFDLNGKNVTVGDLILGIKDVNPSVENDQSGFGAINLNGGTMSVTNVVFRSNPDGTDYNQVTLTSDSYFTSSSGSGTLEFAGDLATVTTRSPARWAIEGTTLRANGDGSSVQHLEVLSRDFGDSPFGLDSNYSFGTFEVAAGARVQLQDLYDNDHVDNTKEAMYVDSLVVAEGATLDLNGIHIYARTTDIQGTVVENGGAILPFTAAQLV